MLGPATDGSAAGSVEEGDTGSIPRGLVLRGVLTSSPRGRTRLSATEALSSGSATDTASSAIVGKGATVSEPTKPLEGIESKGVRQDHLLLQELEYRNLLQVLLQQWHQHNHVGLFFLCVVLHLEKGLLSILHPTILRP